MEEKNQELEDTPLYGVKERPSKIRFCCCKFSAIGESLTKLNSGIETIKQLMSPILPVSEDQKSVGSADHHDVDMGNIFTINEDDEVNLSFRDNEVAVLSVASMFHLKRHTRFVPRISDCARENPDPEFQRMSVESQR